MEDHHEEIPGIVDYAKYSLAILAVSREPSVKSHATVCDIEATMIHETVENIQRFQRPAAASITNSVLFIKTIIE
jgi:hypothetical protein